MTFAAVAGNDSVFNPHNAISKIQHAGIMRHNHYRTPALVRKVAHHLHDISAGVRIQRRGRLIGENDSWIPCEGPCDRDPLLLPSAQIRRDAAVLFASPTCSSNSAARFLAFAAEIPLRSSINSTFSPAVSVGNRLNP